MLILHGMYHWRRRRVAYRNDYCLRCEVPRLSFQHRTFDVLHVFWIPLLPLGFWKRWHCGTCGSDPHAHVRTRRSLKWAGVGVLALISLSAWAVSPAEQPQDAPIIWAMRMCGPLAAAAAAWATARSPPDVKLADKLRAVVPIVDPHCPVCGVMLFPEEPAWSCPSCGIRRRALPVG